MAPAAVTLERHDTVGLAWSKAAILDSLQLARQALEQFAREPAEAAPLNEFVSQLHQVQGCLRMLELRGAAHLAEEMQLLGAAMAASEQSPRGECLGALFRGLEQLPAYLERLRGARHDLPLVMLPLLNQLRHCRGLEPLAEGSLNQVGAPAAAAADLADLDVSLGNWREQLQAGQGRDALRSVVIALCDDLIRIKERLDHFVRSDRHDAGQMETLLAPLRQIADTLAVLGFQQPRRVIIDQVLALQGLPAHNHAGADALLMDVAGALLYVEATLNGMVGPLEDNDPASLPGSDLLEIRQQVLAECQSVVQQARELIADCLDDDWSWQRLQGVPGLLQQARGALSMLMLAEAAEVLGGCAAYTQGWLNDLDQRPQAATLEPFAEALCAAEFYLQWQLADPLADARPLLQRACASLALLGVPCQQRASTAVASEALDDGLREVFLEEAGELLAEIERQWSLWRAEQTHSTLGELRRALHTLKGSGRMVHAEALAALAWGAEHLLNRVLDGRISLSRDGQAALQQVFVRLPDLLADYAGGQLGSSAENQALADHLHALAQDQAPALADTAGLDPHLLGVFAREAAGHLQALDAFLQQAGASEVSISDALQRALHTLKGSAAMAGVEPMAQLATALDRLVREHKAHGLLLGGVQLQQLQAAHGLLQRGLAQLDSAPLAAIAGAGELIEQIEQSVQQALAQPSYAEQPVARDPQATARLLGEAMDHVLEAEAALARWQAAPAQRDQLDGLLDELTALGHAAHLADLWSLDQLCESLLDLLGAVEEGSLAATDTLFALLAQGLEGMLDMLDEVAAGQDVEPRPALLARLHEHLHGALDPASLGVVGPQGVRALELPVAPSDTAEGELEALSELDEAPGDKALLEVFLEESSDIVESSAAALARWQADPRNTAEVETLLRDLHTLKGGARMVEISAIGDLAHELEFLYELFAAGRLPPSLALFSLLQNCHDRLAHMLDAVRLEQPLHAATALIDYIRNFTSSALNDTVAGVLPSEAAPAEAPAASHERATGDMVKVDAELLDELGNLASEHSIIRGRIEQQVNDGQFALNEMETTLERMRDQLLRLDNETQSRVLSRHQAEGDTYDDFDPLEMDRHSQLQQLSRALFESASDLLDLKETLAQRAQHTHGLLQQQARINSQLQEGLTATLMVPFERLVPRLQRVVRQVASELGKQVELVVGNAEGELDRSVLERMVAPLEHMLRNAVDHGLETSSARRAAGKPEQGTIHLGLLHEGADIVIEMSDDGAGVPLEAVRKKAIKRGLLDPEATLSDHEVLQFILRPGFSTAEKITQISGRGLGMDVVHEEVKQLGGSMSIESSPGKGARFQIRLPFTVSLNRALMVHLGEEQYAIGLNTIEGVVRVPPAELEACYRLDPPQYVYAGYQYQLRYLGELLQGTPQPNLLGQSVPLPVLLVHSQEQSFAIQVDGLSPSREIVVKSLGPQFAAVPGLAGATLLGDGRVVLILDLLGQLRGQQRRLARLPSAARSTPMLPGSSRQRSLLVMVVDDSVTVRKVTSRLLERHGMSVLTAKDGVDAMALLQEHCPDVLLLDIEMPRMDGFEVATRIRQDERLRHLPIIMITSRSGQKHRERAMAIGVNEYLGKPYQESQLLHSIAHWSAPHA